MWHPPAVFFNDLVMKKERKKALEKGNEIYNSTAVSKEKMRRCPGFAPVSFLLLALAWAAPAPEPSGPSTLLGRCNGRPIGRRELVELTVKDEDPPDRRPARRLRQWCVEGVGKEGWPELEALLGGPSRILTLHRSSARFLATPRTIRLLLGRPLLSPSLRIFLPDANSKYAAPRRRLQRRRLDDDDRRRRHRDSAAADEAAAAAADEAASRTNGLRILASSPGATGPLALEALASELQQRTTANCTTAAATAAAVVAVKLISIREQPLIDSSVFVGRLVVSVEPKAAWASSAALRDCIASTAAAHNRIVHVETRHLIYPRNQLSQEAIRADFLLIDKSRTALGNNGSSVRGAGEVVGVSDSGVDVQHCHFHDPERAPPLDSVDPLHRKIVHYVGESVGGDFLDDQIGHGTHVAGTIAGLPFEDDGGLVSPQPRNDSGVCPDCKLVFLDMDRVATSDGYGGAYFSTQIDDLTTQLYPSTLDAGGRIHSMSWGSDYNDYDATTQDVDEMSELEPGLLSVVAAGNTGDTGAGSVGSPATSKSCVSVGATKTIVPAQKPSTRIHVLAEFSSRGPTFDGRLKPDVVAPGTNIMSSKVQGWVDGVGIVNETTCATHTMTGTSMATPLVSGAAALVRDYLKNGHYEWGCLQGSGSATVAPGNTSERFVDPSAALVRALLIHGAKPVPEMTNEEIAAATSSSGGHIKQAPPFLATSAQGFGLIDMEETLMNLAPRREAAAQKQSRRLYVIDDVLLEEAGEVATVCLRSTNEEGDDDQLDSGFKATLAWSDPPGPLHSSSSAFGRLTDPSLVNDLDLIATTISTTMTTAGTGDEKLEGSSIVKIAYGNSNISRYSDGGLRLRTAPSSSSSSSSLSISTTKVYQNLILNELPLYLRILLVSSYIATR